MGIPIGRIIEKVDAFYSQRDYQSAERVLLYWLNEAINADDKRSQLSLLNELMGNYRKTSQADKAAACAEDAVRLCDDPELSGTTSAANVFINAATVCQAFGEAEKSLPLFEKAQEIYSANEADDELVAALSNNFATALTSLGRYEKAREAFENALMHLGDTDNGKLDRAITYLNLAGLVEAQKGLVDGADEIDDFLDSAERMFNDTSISAGSYYAFVCDKCAPTFEYYGRFFFAEELNRRKRKFYEGA